MPNHFDGRRGIEGLGGWWVSVEEAQEYAVGNDEWWWNANVSGADISVKQYDSKGPANKPIWMYHNGDMYLGEWRHTRRTGIPVEHGTGASYTHNPCKYRGVVYVGEWKEGQFHGAARVFWLDSAPSWIKNELGDTGIRQHDGNRLISQPYTYVGNYVHNVEIDDAATVTLKDGTTRIGPWKAGKPVGDWWKDHQSAAALPQERASTKPAKRTAMKRANSSLVKKIPAPQKKSARGKKPVRQSDRVDSEETRCEATGSRVYGVEGVNSVGTPQKKDGEEQKAVTEGDREDHIAEWLCDVIGYNPDKEEMKEYAKQFIEISLHSSQMIRDLLPANRVAAFFWMKEFHRQQFLSNANLLR